MPGSVISVISGSGIFGSEMTEQQKNEWKNALIKKLGQIIDEKMKGLKYANK